VTAVLAQRGTSNSNARGSAADRLARKLWLMDAYASDVQSHVRCYRCGEPLDIDTVTVDRIIPGCLGGTYRRNNIRPACGTCNYSTGGALSHLPKKKAKR
jgi:hypothetical protein